MILTLEEFSKYVNHKDIKQEMHKYFDEHILLYSLIHSNFSDMTIDLKEDEDGCYYVLCPDRNIDISYMEQFYNNISVNFFSHRYIVSSKLCDNKNIIIRFIDKNIRSMA
jgi:hypothetical protein